MPSAGPDATGPKTKEQKRAEAEARNRAYRATKDAKARAATLDDALGVAQMRHDELVALMATPELYADSSAFEAAVGEYNSVKRELRRLEDEWIGVQEEIERLEREES